jgi:hypothetical protein
VHKNTINMNNRIPFITNMSPFIQLSLQCLISIDYRIVEDLNFLKCRMIKNPL